MEWHFLNNQFDNATAHSNLRMVIITNDHHSRLKAQEADPDILALLTRTTPVHEAFLSAYSAAKSAVGLRKSATQSVTNKLAYLRSTQLRQWDAIIQVQHLSGTEDYTAILPNGLTAFHKSTIDQTVIMLKGLEERLADYASLAAVKTEVETFHTELEGLRDAQQVKEQLIENASDLLEQARTNLASIMYGNLGVLMDKYRDTPEFIANFWELQLIQRHGNGQDANEPETEEYSGTVQGGQTANVVPDLTGISTAVISNTGNATLRFCAALNGSEACDADYSVELAPGAVHEATGEDFDNPENKFLNVTNIDPDAGSYFVEIVRGGPQPAPAG